ncbi:MAG: ribokinase [Leptolyngbya sp. PLA3]|nr:MAG: ribokinase [Cyanobacteria bacterium CYA]MCE7968835.1 ribokinase [Leptolyngbya sp. PL-A3]
MTGRVCIVGSINMDLVVRAPRLPAPGQTLMGGPFARFPGGKGANQAVAAARAGAHVAMLGAVGDDEHGLAMRTTLSDHAVDVARVSTRSGTATGVALITVDDAGENTIVVAPGANASLSPEAVASAADVIRHADVLLAQLEVPLEAVAKAASIARSAHTKVMLNAAPAQSLPRDLLALLDVLIVNRGEAALIAGRSPEEDPASLAKALQTLGVPEIVITLGGDGALHAGARTTRIAAFHVEPIDTVGAGDAFAGAFAAAIADKMPTEAALRFAAAAGALATTKQGAIPSLPTRAEIQHLLG